MFTYTNINFLKKGEFTFGSDQAFFGSHFLILCWVSFSQKEANVHELYNIPYFDDNVEKARTENIRGLV